MAIELRRPQAADLPELGRVCYEAFKDISERHGFPSDFPSVEFAQALLGLMLQQEAFYSVGAYDGAAVKGSNFVSLFDEVAGIGPVSVDVNSQGQGIGRKEMEDVIAAARQQGFEMVRLMQDSFNMQSLALYTSLGFDVKEPVSYLALSNAGPADPAVRPMTAADLPAMDELCRSIYRISRTNECATLLQIGLFPGYVLDRGHIVGYLIGGAAGHGVAETDGDMAALINSLGASVADAHAFVPIRNGELYRKLLTVGHRNQKVMNLMALGPYEEPQGSYTPSVWF